MCPCIIPCIEDSPRHRYWTIHVEKVVNVDSILIELSLEQLVYVAIDVNVVKNACIPTMDKMGHSVTSFEHYQNGMFVIPLIRHSWSTSLNKNMLLQ